MFNISATAPEGIYPITAIVHLSDKDMNNVQFSVINGSIIIPPKTAILDRIEVNPKPDKLEYIEGEALNLKGMVVTAFYNNGKQEVTNYTTNPANGAILNTVGKQIVTVNYAEGDSAAETSFTVDVFPHVHKWDDGTVTIEPTCKVKGDITFTCKHDGCGARYTEDIDIDPDNHVGGTFKKAITAATCNVEGVMGIYCDDCGALLGTEIIPATGLHDYCEVCGKCKIHEGCSHGGSITSLVIDAPIVTIVTRNSIKKFNVILNEGASADGLIWSVNNPLYASVSQNGTVALYNMTGSIILTVTDPVSKISNSIIIRIM